MAGQQRTIAWTPQSSNIAACDFDAETDTLTIEFHSGATYDYLNVPASVARDFQNAPSAGQFFTRHIKSRYPYEEK